MPLQAAPIASPAPARSAANDVVLNAEIAEDADHEHDVQYHTDDRTEILRERRVDRAAVHTGAQHTYHAVDDPAADHPEQDGGGDLDEDVERGGA
jgi:hypothetical protein